MELAALSLVSPFLGVLLTLVEALLLYCHRHLSPLSVAELRKERSRCLHLVCCLAWFAAEAPWPPCLRLRS